MSQLRANIECKIGSFDLSVKFDLMGGINILTGPSGCGKSSVLNLIAGLRKPDKGHISCGTVDFFDSESKINLSPKNRHCGYLFQNLALFPHLTVAGNICFGIDKLPPAERQKRLEELLSLIKLSGLENRSIAELSGGQLQRVALARAMAPHPAILLLDEPFSALDTELREDLGEELKILVHNLGVPTLMVTHSRSEALRMGQTIIAMENGRIYSAGTALEFGAETTKTTNSAAHFSW